MKTSWLLETDSNPLGSVRQFLLELWPYAGLSGMLIPVYQSNGTQVSPAFVDDPGQLGQSDPFAPVILGNSAKLAPAAAADHPKGMLGAVFRSCEARAFDWMAEQKKLAPKRWLVIGVDCLASFPGADFDWRVSKAGSVERLTREALRFARLGGIAPYRYRHACQMCATPASDSADLRIELLGLPVKQVVLITTKNQEIAKKLRLQELTDGLAPASLVARREATLTVLAGRRRRALDRMVQALADDAPTEVDAFLEHLANCVPCSECLQACPVYTGDFYPGDIDAASMQAARCWLNACVSCGMCEDVCPRHLPLMAIINQINQVPNAYRAGVVS
jgi:formate hydrogenlyase subunit 6/NADH:ubiquinone oxidoreductase subunit I